MNIRKLCRSGYSRSRDEILEMERATTKGNLRKQETNNCSSLTGLRQGNSDREEKHLEMERERKI